MVTLNLNNFCSILKLRNNIYKELDWKLVPLFPSFSSPVSCLHDPISIQDELSPNITFHLKDCNWSDKWLTEKKFSAENMLVNQKSWSNVITFWVVVIRGEGFNSTYSQDRDRLPQTAIDPSEICLCTVLGKTMRMDHWFRI